MRPHRRQPTRLPRPWDSLGKNTGVGCHFLLQCMKVKSENEVAQSCPTLSDPMDCSLPGSSVHGIFQAEYWSGVPLPPLSTFSKSSLNIWKFSPFTYCWSLAWRIFEHYFASLWDECNCAVVWTFFGIAFWDWNENDLFQSYGHGWVFQICWHIECSFSQHHL